MNLSNTCSSKRVKPIRFLLGHSVYYLWVNKVQAPRKLISQLSLQKFFNSLAQHGSAQFNPVNGHFLNWRESVIRDDLSAFKPPADHCPSDVRTRTVTDYHQHEVANLILFMLNKSEKNVFQSALHSSDTRSSQSSRSGPHPLLSLHYFCSNGEWTCQSKWIVDAVDLGENHSLCQLRRKPLC